MRVPVCVFSDDLLFLFLDVLETGAAAAAAAIESGEEDLGRLRRALREFVWPAECPSASQQIQIVSLANDWHLSCKVTKRLYAQLSLSNIDLLTHLFCTSVTLFFLSKKIFITFHCL